MRGFFVNSVTLSSLPEYSVFDFEFQTLIFHKTQCQQFDVDPVTRKEIN